MNLNDQHKANRARLKWACRRGMLELDVLLMNFLDGQYARLSAHDQALFAALLDQPDPTLFSWLLGNQEPEQEFAALVTMIRQHAQSRL